MSDCFCTDSFGPPPGANRPVILPPRPPPTKASTARSDISVCSPPSSVCLTAISASVCAMPISSCILSSSAIRSSSDRRSASASAASSWSVISRTLRLASSTESAAAGRSTATTPTVPSNIALTNTWAAIRRNRGLGRRLNMTLGRLANITNVLQSGYSRSFPFIPIRWCQAAST